jgi:PAS domain S-box-containing protein
MITNIQTRIILLFAFLVVALLSAFILLKQWDRYKMERLFQNEKSRGDVLIDRILNLKSSSLKAFVNDYSFFDEMVSFVSNRDKRWAAENIDTGLTTFKADAAWVYRPDFSPVYSTALSEKGRFAQLSLDAGVRRMFSEKRHFVEFYLDTPEGLMEIHGATIHPTRDSLRRTPKKGYFFVGRLWTPDYIDGVAKLTDSAIKIIRHGKDASSDPAYRQVDGALLFSRALTGWDGRPVADLQFKSESRLIGEFNYSARRQLFLLVFFGMALLAITFLAVMEMVTVPLGKISKSLQTDEPSHVRELQKNGTEFGRIAVLIDKFFAQKKDLVDEVSRRVRIEDALRKSEEKYRDLAELLPLSIFEMDDKGMLTFVNRYALNTFGYTPEDVDKGLHGLHTIESEDRERAAEDIQRILAGEQLRSAEYVMLKRDGPTFPALIYVSLVMNEGKPAGLRGVVIDLTDRKKMEEEQIRSQKLESIGILAGGVAHDFNNMLTGILGNISLAKMLIEEQEELNLLLGEAEKASLRAKDLTQQLLTFSKRSAPLKKIISVKQIVFDSASFALRGSGIRCDFSIPADTWPVEADAGQMCQVVNNLIINANQAMMEGGVIRVYAENVKVRRENLMPLKEGRYVKITFEDEGLGISREHIKKIFDPYFTTKQSGTGLGLATTYSIVRNHGGHIDVESELGEGSRFNVYLPSAEARPESGEDDEETILMGIGKVLVMDDEEAIRRVAGSMLSHLGYTAEVCSNGAEAAETYGKALETGEPFDAVILDLTVQGGSGAKELIKKLLEIDPGVKAIVSSGYPDDPVLESYGYYGFRGTVHKPFQIKELSRTLHEVLTALLPSIVKSEDAG